jgi:recombinational DNA repair protein (RecF pathway)
MNPTPETSGRRDFRRCAACRELKTGVRFDPLSGRLICEDCRASGAPGTCQEDDQHEAAERRERAWEVLGL